MLFTTSSGNFSPGKFGFRGQPGAITIDLPSSFASSLRESAVRRGRSEGGGRRTANGTCSSLRWGIRPATAPLWWVVGETVIGADKHVEVSRKKDPPPFTRNRALRSAPGGRREPVAGAVWGCGVRKAGPIARAVRWGRAGATSGTSRSVERRSLGGYTEAALCFSFALKESSHDAFRRGSGPALPRGGVRRGR